MTCISWRAVLSAGRPRLAMIVVAVVAAAGSAMAQNAGPPSSQMAAAPLSGAQAQQLVDLLQNDAKRQSLLVTLRALAATAPAPEQGPAPPPSAASPAAQPATPAANILPVGVLPGAAPPAATPKGEDPLKIGAALKPGSLGDELIGQTSNLIDSLSDQATATTQAVVQLPAVWFWLQATATDPFVRWRVLDAAWKLTLIVALAFALKVLIQRGLRPVLRIVEQAAPGVEGPSDATKTVTAIAHPTRARAATTVRLLRRLPGALLRAAICFLPFVAFAGCAYFLLGTSLVTLSSTRLVVLDAVKAYVIFSAVGCVAVLLFAPREPQWRLVEISDETANYAKGWIGWLSGIAIFGGTAATIALNLGLSLAAHEGMLKIVALVVHVWLVVVIWRGRHIVARRLRLRGTISPLWAGIAQRLASNWHWLASILIMALWLVWAVQAQNGVQRVLSWFVITLGVLIGARLLSILALGSLDRAFKFSPDPTRRSPVLDTRVGRYYPLLRRVVFALIYLAAIFALLEAWGANVGSWFAVGTVGSRTVSASITVLIIAGIALLCWELANAWIEGHLRSLSSRGRHAQAGRLRTLAPLLRSCLLAAILVVVALTGLSELGVNIAPLLAGAGIFGVAIGFGSQKLVQDFITGIFLLLENAMQVGEWVTVSGLSGTVENLSVRTIRLRAGDGSVHVIPFSSVTTVTNTNRGIGNAPVSVTVSIGEDVDEVGDALKQIAAEMRADPSYARGIRSDLALWGVDKLDASTVTIVGQIECTDDARWGVQREFNRRLKKRFQELGIVLANPSQTVLIEEAARVEAKVAEARAVAAAEGEPSDPGQSSASVAQSPPSAALGHAA